MNNFFEISAEITFYSSYRPIPIKTGYCAEFSFNKGSWIMGFVRLLDRTELKTNETTEVIISFHSDEPFGNVKINDKFEFYEGRYKIGEGAILDYIGWR